MTSAVLRKKWRHEPCPYHAVDEDCPVCDDPVCELCGNPGWACECARNESEEPDVEQTEAKPEACSICGAEEVACERESCAYKGPCSTFRPCYSSAVNDTRCPLCGSTKNAHNRIYLNKINSGERPW